MNSEQALKNAELVKLLRSERVKDHFDIGCWTYGDITAEKLGCDTAACVAGWATLVFDDLIIDRWGDIALSFDSAMPSGWAFCYVSGIGECEAEDLLYPESYDSKVTPDMAADRLVEIMKKYGYDENGAPF